MSEPPDWAVSLARALVVAHYNSTDYEATVAIARAIADAVDAARVEIAGLSGRIADRMCTCNVPSLEGAGQHSPVCAIFNKAKPQHDLAWMLHDDILALRGEEPKP